MAKHFRRLEAYLYKVRRPFGGATTYQCGEVGRIESVRFANGSTCDFKSDGGGPFVGLGDKIKVSEYGLSIDYKDHALDAQRYANWAYEQVVNSDAKPKFSWDFDAPTGTVKNRSLSDALYRTAIGDDDVRRECWGDVLTTKTPRSRWERIADMAFGRSALVARIEELEKRVKNDRYLIDQLRENQANPYPRALKQFKVTVVDESEDGDEDRTQTYLVAAESLEDARRKVSRVAYGVITKIAPNKAETFLL